MALHLSTVYHTTRLCQVVTVKGSRKHLHTFSASKENTVTLSSPQSDFRLKPKTSFYYIKSETETASSFLQDQSFFNAFSQLRLTLDFH